MSERGSRLRRRVVTLSIIAAAAIVAFIVAGLPLFVFPSTDEPRDVDAIIVLGPPREGRIDTAQRLAAEGHSDTIVIAVDDYGIDSALNIDACAHPETQPAGRPVVRCLIPQPFTTAGEALMVERLAAEEGWESVMIVTSVTHVTRARMIFTSCLGGGVLVTTDGAGIGDLNWAEQYIYQTGAFAKALIAPTC